MNDVARLVLITIGAVIVSLLASYTVTGGWGSLAGLRRLKKNRKAHDRLVRSLDALDREIAEAMRNEQGV